MKKFTDHDYANLEPREQPYEVRVELDMALRIFPNGSKAWVHIYCDREGVQRETLGIYPDMEIDQAYQALVSARKGVVNPQSMRSEREEEATQVDHDQPPSKKGRARRLSAIVTSGLVALLLVAYNLPMGEMMMDKAKNSATPAAEIVERVAVPLQKESNIASLPEVVVEAEELEPVVAVTTETSPPLMPEIVIQKSKPLLAKVGESTENIIKPEVSTHAQKERESPILPVSRDTLVDSGEIAVSTGLVRRAQFTSGIENREPVDQITPFTAATDADNVFMQLYFFTEVTQLEGRTIYHRWELNGEVLAEIPFEVKSAWRWRVFSSKQILPTMQGEWQVSVVDDMGNTLHLEQFSTGSSPDKPENRAETVTLLLQ